MFKKIGISNFRGIEKLELEDINQLNLIVGLNNTGKTSVLEAMFLITGISNSRLPLIVNSFRYFDLVGEISWKGFFRDLNPNNKIELKAEFNDKSNRKLRIIPHLSKDIAKDKINTSSTSTYDVDGLVFDAIIKEKGKNQKKISSDIMIDLDKKDQPAIITNIEKNYKELRRGIFISDRTKNDLASRFDNMQKRKEKEQVLEILKKIEPRIKDIALGQEGIVYVDINLDTLVPIHLMGGGMIKILAVVLAIMDTKNGVVLIDEIENGLYFKFQKILWEAISLTANKFNVQVIATTHSIDSIRAFSDVLGEEMRGNLYRIELTKGIHNTVILPQNEIKLFLEKNWEMR